MARKYEKKSQYWAKRAEKNQSDKVSEIVQTVQDLNSQIKQFTDIDYQDVSMADSSDNYSRTSNSNFSSALVNAKYPNLSKGLLPYKTNGSIVSVTDAIKLCQLAYANIAIVRNTVENFCEFANSPIHVKSENKTVEKFFERWFKKIGLWKLADEFYREYYRSGNIFIYRFDGKFDSESFNSLKTVFALKSNKIPLAYTILNPSEVGVEWSPLGYGNYVKMLSYHELAKLRDSKDPAIKEFLSQFDAKTKKQLFNYTGDELYMSIDPDRLSCVFYKKQSYEPLAIPMIYPVLDDIEWKLALKNMDKLLAKSIDNIVLLITMGAKKDEGGINYNNITRMQELFRNQSAGRVIVSDYTTKAEFLVPELQNILGPEKYTIVDRDIKEGLQNILAGTSESEKFSNLAIKTKVFLERLKEGQNAFKTWLEREVVRVCEIMNFKNVPELQMEEVDLENKDLAQKTFIRLYELGFFTPDDLIEAFKTGLMPDVTELLSKQKEFKDQREDKLWFPVQGGSNFLEPTQDELMAAGVKTGRPTGTGTPKSSNKVGVRKNLSFADLKISIEDIKSVYEMTGEFTSKVKDVICQKMNIEILDDVQKELIKDFANAIIVRYDKKDWESKIDYVYENLGSLEDTSQLQTVKLWANEASLDEYNTSILYHANQLKVNN